MRMAKTCGATRLIIYGDSNLVVQQAMRNCDAIADNMAAYQKLHNALEGSFDGYELNYVTRGNNTEADELANIGSTRGSIPPGVFLESIKQRSIKARGPKETASVSFDKATGPEQVATTHLATSEVGDNETAESEPVLLEGPMWTK